MSANSQASLESPPQRWAVLGGGMLGLALAWRLARAGKQVTIYEASDRLGGLAAPQQLGDTVWDRFYHVTLLSDSYTRGLLRDLDLEHEMQWVETRTGFYAQGRLTSLSNALEYLRLPTLSLLDRLRLALTILYASRIDDWRKLETVTVEEWLTKLSGARTFHKLWKPLLRAKLGEAYTESSAAFIWATIQRLYAARRSGLKKEMFGYLPGGYARVFAALAAKLRSEKVQIRTEQRINQVFFDRTQACLQVETASGHCASFDRVVATFTPGNVARICPNLSTEERTLFENVPYQGIVCASLLLKKPLANYYLTYITDCDLPFTTVIEMSAFVSPHEFGGRSLVYLPRYIDASDPFFALSDAEIQETFLKGLERMFPTFRREDLLAAQVAREREVFPLPRLDYSKSLPPIQTSVPGFYAVSSAQIVNGTLNVNDTLRLAERAAAQLLDSKSSAPSSPSVKLEAT